MKKKKPIPKKSRVRPKARAGVSLGEKPSSPAKGVKERPLPRGYKKIQYGQTPTIVYHVKKNGKSFFSMSDRVVRNPVFLYSLQELHPQFRKLVKRAFGL